MILLKLILIPMMIKVLLATRKPLLCALLYGAALFTNGLVFDLAFSGDWLLVTGKLALSTALAYGFFWLLKAFEDAGALYWGIVALGTALLIAF